MPASAAMSRACASWSSVSGDVASINHPAVTRTKPCRDNLPQSGPGRYDPQLGVMAATGLSVLDIPIRIEPAAPNKLLEWDVTFYSNDPDEPEAPPESP